MPRREMDSIIRDAKVSDHNETDNDLPFEEIRRDVDLHVGLRVRVLRANGTPAGPGHSRTDGSGSLKAPPGAAGHSARIARAAQEACLKCWWRRDTVTGAPVGTVKTRMRAAPRDPHPPGAFDSTTPDSGFGFGGAYFS